MASFSAMAQAIIAALGTIVAIVGTIMVFRTFEQTRLSASAAVDMAREARAATAAAIKSASVAEAALKGIERPFLVFVPDTATQPDPTKQSYVFKNLGRTPCLIVHSQVNYLPITPVDVPEPLKPDALQAAFTPDWIVVAPNGGETPEERVGLGKPIVPGAERAGMVMLHGYAIYRSLTGDYFECGFGLYKDDREGQWKALTQPSFNYDERREPGVPRTPKPKVTIVESYLGTNRIGTAHARAYQA